jgi:hypothetical protein
LKNELKIKAKIKRKAKLTEQYKRAEPKRFAAEIDTNPDEQSLESEEKAKKSKDLAKKENIETLNEPEKI